MGQIARRRRRWPFVLVALLVVAVGLLVAADVAARRAAQDAIANDVRRSTHAEEVSVSIHGFPFLWDAAVEGRIPGVYITERGVPAGPVRVDRVGLDLTEVRFDRNRLLFSRIARVTSVARATVAVDVRLTSVESSLAQALGVTVTATASNRVVVAADGLTVTTINLTRIPIVPYCPLHIGQSSDTYTFSCTVSPVPPSVLAALSKGHKV